MVLCFSRWQKKVALPKSYNMELPLINFAYLSDDIWAYTSHVFLFRCNSGIIQIGLCIQQSELSVASGNSFEDSKNKWTLYRHVITHIYQKEIYPQCSSLKQPVYKRLILYLWTEERIIVLEMFKATCVHNFPICFLQIPICIF